MGNTTMGFEQVSRTRFTKQYGGSQVIIELDLENNDFMIDHPIVDKDSAKHYQMARKYARYLLERVRRI